MKRLLVVAFSIFMVARASDAEEQAVSPHGLSFTLDPSRTAPGTLEAEAGPVVETREGLPLVDFPWILKFTGDTDTLLLRDTEFALTGGINGDFLGLIVRRPFYRGEHLALAISPRASFPLSGDATPNPGLAGLASIAGGLNGFVVNGELNRNLGAVRTAVSGDYSRNLSTTGAWSKLYLFAGLLAEFTDSKSFSAGEGVIYRPRPSVELEFACRQLDLAGEREIVLLVDLIANFGRVQR